MAPATKTILVLEDDASIRDTLCEILELEGYRVITAQNGEEGLQKLAASHGDINLILLDLMMPIMDGFTFRLEQLKNVEWAKIPVVIMSADGHVEKKLAQIAAVDYLRKPPDLDVFISAVNRYTQSRATL